MKGIFRRYWEAVLVYKWLWTIVVIGHIVFFIGNSVATPFVYSQFIEKISGIGSGTELADFYPIILIMVGVHIVQTSFGQVALYGLRRAIPGSMKYLEDTAFEYISKKSAGFYANNFTGSIVTKFNRYSRAFQVVAESVAFELTDMLVQFIFPLIFMFIVAPRVAVVYLIFAVVMAVSLFWMHRRKIPYSRAVAEQESVKTGILADAMTNIISIKTFSSRPQEIRTFKKSSLSWRNRFLKNSQVGNRIRLYKITIWTINEAIVMLFVAAQAIDGALAIGSAVAIMLYVRQLSSSVWSLGKIIERTEQSVADATEMVDILNEPLAVADPENPQKFNADSGHIMFDDIKFTYEDIGSSEVFASLNLDIAPQQKVGLVGPSGGGKTTFVRLLLRFADLQEGAITIDGQDISKVAQDDLRRAIAYVPQEPILFHRTIAENITYGTDGVSDKKLAEITHLSHVDEFIDDLPQGLETMVGERGVKLSGGQKQRIAIARAMLKPAPILVLDEATSALDSKSEKLIIQALDNLMKGRTTIVIAHRLSTIKKLDRIVVLDRGEVKEDGTHAQLLRKKNGTYANLWKHQMGNFIE